MPDLNHIRTKEPLRELCRQVYPAATEARINNVVGQLFACVPRITAGDLVVLPRKRTSTIALGRVTGAFQYREDLGEAHHVRPVTWMGIDVSRTDVAQDPLYSLGAFMTVCRISHHQAEERFQQIVQGKKDPGLVGVPRTGGGESSDREAAGDIAETDVEPLVQDQILSDIEAHFRGHRLARLVEAVLQAEGYQTQLSPPGPDGGVDILDGRGALGFESPRLCIQVKSSRTRCDVTVLRGLQGTMATFKAEQG